ISPSPIYLSDIPAYSKMISLVLSKNSFKNGTSDVESVFRISHKFEKPFISQKTTVKNSIPSLLALFNKCALRSRRSSSRGILRHNSLFSIYFNCFVFLIAKEATLGQGEGGVSIIGNIPYIYRILRST